LAEGVVAWHGRVGLRWRTARGRSINHPDFSVSAIVPVYNGGEFLAGALRNILEQAIATFEPGAVARAFFKYSQQGWQFAGAGDCRECEYVDPIMLPEKRHAERFPVQPDGAAAAWVVACVKLEKPAQRPQPSPAAADRSRGI
jgi:hypothetical protein